MKQKTVLLLTFLLQVNFLSATTVTGFAATHKHGQVFCTWNNLTSSGIQYRLYQSTSPIIHGSQLAACDYLGAVRDSSSYNKRLSEAESEPYFLKIDSLAVPLDVNTGLFVTTTVLNGSFYYALTTVATGIEDTTIIAGVNSLSNPVSEMVEQPLPVYQVTLVVSSHMADVYVLYTSLTATELFPRMVNVGSYPFNFAVNRNGFPPHPLTIRLSGGGSNFLSGIFSDAAPDEYRIGLDDWLPNDERSSWFGYHEQYDIFSHDNPPPVTGINYDYALQRLGYIIDWAIRNLPVDSNSIYFSGVSSGAAGSFFASLTYPDRIAAASLNVPKFDLSFLHDPDTTNNYNEGMPGRLRVDTLLGTVPTNLTTNWGVPTYDLLNGGWLAHEHSNDNVPLLFAVNGKRDTMVGWAEKIPYYDSVNANRLGGYYFWDLRKHNGDGENWIFSPDLFRYHRNVSFPAFSNCSVNDDPGDGNLSSGDSLGSINGFLDWNDSIADDSSHYHLAVFMKDLPVHFGAVIAPDSCFTDLTLRRLQNFNVPLNAMILWETVHGSQAIQNDSFLYSGGLITLKQVKIFKDTSMIRVSFTIPTQVNIPENHPQQFALFPNPANGQITIDGLTISSINILVTISDVTGKKWHESTFVNFNRDQNIVIDVGAFAPGIYFVNVNGSVKAFVKQ